MTLSGELPEDPNAPIEESILQRNIDSIDWRKENEGITWSQYLAGVIELFELGDSSEEPIMSDQIMDLQTLLPELQEAERLNNSDFQLMKRVVTQEVLDTLIVTRELMEA